jgi:hypothetical protein
MARRNLACERVSALLVAPMIKSPAEEKPSDVPMQVFEEFLHALEEAKVSTELVARLRKTLTEERIFTERALRVAVLGQETLP